MSNYLPIKRNECPIFRVFGYREIRSWIVKQNSEFVKEEKKAAREKVLVDKEKVLELI